MNALAIGDPRRARGGSPGPLSRHQPLKGPVPGSQLGIGAALRHLSVGQHVEPASANRARSARPNTRSGSGRTSWNASFPSASATSASMRRGRAPGVSISAYVNRPPLAKTRLEARPDGSVSVGMKRTFADGTSAFVYTAEELAERLCAIVPPPRANQTVYHGIFAGNSAWRPEVVPKPPPVSAREKKRRQARRLRRLTPLAGLGLPARPRLSGRLLPMPTLRRADGAPLHRRSPPGLDPDLARARRSPRAPAADPKTGRASSRATGTRGSAFGLQGTRKFGPRPIFSALSYPLEPS